MTQKKNWKRVAGANIARLTDDRARKILAEIAAEGNTIHHQAIRDLTGGFASQAINGYVTRRLGIKAGYIK